MAMLASHRRFVSEYLIPPHNASAACLRAGYKTKNPDAMGAKLKAHPEIKEAIEAGMAKVEAESFVSAKYVLTNLREIVDRCMQKAPVMEFHPELKQMVQLKDGETGADLWEFDAGSANRALELLGKHLKLFTEKMEVTMSEGYAERLKRYRERVKRG